MYITFLVGNGFDKACEFNTSFSEFCKWYVDQETDSEVIKAFKDAIRKDVAAKTGFWSDFEIAFGAYSNRINTLEEFVAINEDVHDSMIKYLRKESDCYEYNLSPEVDLQSVRSGLANFYNELNASERRILTYVCDSSRNPEIVFKFITFNYTSFLDKCIKTLSEAPLYFSHTVNGIVRRIVDPQVLHVHGFLDLYPILGVNDESQFLNKELLKHYGVAESVIKDQSDRIAGEEWLDSATRLIEDSTVICIYGMSLGASDAYWWKTILTWLQGNAKNHLVVFQYLETGKDTTSFYKNATMKKNLIDSLFAVTRTETSNDEEYRNRIHVIYNTKSLLKVSFEKKKDDV